MQAQKSTPDSSKVVKLGAILKIFVDEFLQPLRASQILVEMSAEKIINKV
jgi:hypothetical protein